MPHYAEGMQQQTAFPRYTEDGEYIFTVAELNQAAATALQTEFKLIFVAGEISNFSRPSSGHIYFSLKDEHAQIRCAWFRGRQTPLAFQLETGLSVIALAEVTIYPERGDYQLVIQKMFLSGQGLIQQELEALKRKLSAEGLFDVAHKKTLPRFPQTIGVITSKTGAALQDVLAVYKRRAPFIAIRVYPCLVQGEQATRTIIQALQQADAEGASDALILTRGGGSNEDLWAFNHEGLARAIFACKTPVVSAVGHEIDLTLSDLVADQRAPTPSAAAELLSPSQEELLIQFEHFQRRINQNITRILQNKTLRLDQNARLIKHPQEKVAEKIEMVAKKASDLNKIIHNRLALEKSRFELVKYRLNKSMPLQRILLLKQDVARLSHRLKGETKNRLTHELHRFQVCAQKIENVSPIKTLSRGYAILYADKNNVLSDVKQVQVGQKIKAALRDGEFICQVEKITFGS